MFIKDIFKYFAAFVPVDVLERTFQLSSGAAYDAFKTEVLQEESDHRLSGITDFIFGIDADMIRQRITSVHGPYLFVEYNRITSTIASKVDRKDDHFHMAISVAIPQPDNYDLAGSALDQDTTLALISAIRPPSGATCGMTMTPSVAYSGWSSPPRCRSGHPRSLRTRTDGPWSSTSWA